MRTSASLFCENCGAANNTEATACCFCGRTLEQSQPVLYDADDGSLLPNTLLQGRYRILKPLAQGNTGTIYRAQDITLSSRPVAIKEINLRNLDAREKSDAIATFKHEANLLAGLQHASLPSVFEHFEEHNRYYQVMSFIQGETLEKYLERTSGNRLPLVETLQIGRQLCDVLQYLHNQQPPIIFCDVTPGNIMRTPDGQIYLIGFGMAHRFKPGQKKDLAPFGSPGYAPPEQFNKGQATPRSDIYSLGATMYQLLTGYNPANAPLHLPQLKALNPAVPARLSSLIEQMLESDPKKRPTSMLAVERQLQEVSSYITSVQPFSLPVPARPQRKSTWLARLTLILLVACLFAGGFIGAKIGEKNANTANQILSHATATAQAGAVANLAPFARNDPYLPQGRLALADPLTQPGAWQPQSPQTGEQCLFTNNGFEVQEDSPGSFYNCNESAIFQNFAVQVDLTITQGDCGGIILREDAAGLDMYRFEVCSGGSYAFYRFVNGDIPETMISDTSFLIKPYGENTIAAVADGNNFSLYINMVKVASVTDNDADMSSIGTIGFLAHDENIPTSVTYQNATIWAIQ
jgi:hypothetical protein